VQRLRRRARQRLRRRRRHQIPRLRTHTRPCHVSKTSTRTLRWRARAGVCARACGAKVSPGGGGGGPVGVIDIARAWPSASPRGGDTSTPASAPSWAVRAGRGEVRAARAREAPACDETHTREGSERAHRSRDGRGFRGGRGAVLLRLRGTHTHAAGASANRKAKRLRSAHASPPAAVLSNNSLARTHARTRFTLLAVMLSALAAWYAAILASIAGTSMRWHRLNTAHAAHATAETVPSALL
jgi:hypothetical protein